MTDSPSFTAAMKKEDVLLDLIPYHSIPSFWTQGGKMMSFKDMIYYSLSPPSNVCLPSNLQPYRNIFDRRFVAER